MLFIQNDLQYIQAIHFLSVIIALMVEMWVFTAIALFFKPLN